MSEYTSWYVGMRVVCVDADTHQRYIRWQTSSPSLHGLTRGEVYTVRAIGLYRDCPVIWIEEITRPSNPLGTPGFAVQRFRPVVPLSSIDQFKAHLDAPLNTRETV